MVVPKKKKLKNPLEIKIQIYGYSLVELLGLVKGFQLLSFI